MPAKVIGPTTQRVAANLKRLRQRAGLSLREVSRRLDVAGQPILDTSLIRAEQASRPLTADEVVAIAAILDIAPATLLMPAAEAPMVPWDATAELTPGLAVPLHKVWAWATGELPLSGGLPRDVADFMLTNKPHRFQLDMGPAERASVVFAMQGKMRDVMALALRNGVDVADIRTMFEQNLALLLNSMSGWVDGQDS